MERPAAALLLFLFASGWLFASCPHAQRNISLAAVVGEDQGGVFSLSVEVKPGRGMIYTSISPKIGFMVQESEEDAVEYAFSQSGAQRQECDVFFVLGGEFGERRIDGPSAGGAMAIALKAALENRTLRDDVVITGTVSKSGRLGEVGGVIEKAIAAKNKGARYLIVPKTMLYESLFLSRLSSDGSFSVIEASNLSEAEKIFFSDKSEAFPSSIVPKSEQMPSSLPASQYDYDTARFSIVAMRMVELLEAQANRALGGAYQEGFEQDAAKLYFSGTISNLKRQISMGYPFTAANTAFLLSIDAEYLSINSTKPNLDRSIGRASACIDSLGWAEKTKENLHWAIGADLRKIWAYGKLNSTIKARAESEAYSSLRNVLLSSGWCMISRELSAQASDIGGKPIDESALEPLARQKLLLAQSEIFLSDSASQDTMEHLKNGFEAFERGKFGAAIYEATYALSMHKSSLASEGRSLSAEAEALAGESRSSLWGKIYAGQGRYLYFASKEGLASVQDAYRILAYAKALDEASAEIDRAIGKGEEAPLPFQAEGSENAFAAAQKPLLALSLLVCVLSLSIAIFQRSDSLP